MANSQSTLNGRRSKPKKPRRDFPLFAHASGQWAKKVCGRTRYFGAWSDPDHAERLYQTQRVDLEAGREPSPATGSGLTIADAVNLFLEFKHKLQIAGDITPRHFDDLRNICRGLVAHFGRKRIVEELRPADFGTLRTKLAKRCGTYSLRREIAGTRQLFKWCYENDLIDKPVKWGSQFKAPSAKQMRFARNETGDRMLEPADLRRLLAAATPHVNAFMLLALNAGLGNCDIAFLRHHHIKGDWLDYQRLKTAIERRAKLWPETVAAIEAATAIQRKAKKAEYRDLVFVTRTGQPWGYKDKPTSPISSEFRKLLVECDLYQRGRSFYGLRHIHRTIADEARDPAACDLVMGHHDPTMGAHYRQRISDERLRAVADCVREWLFGGAK